ncbi:hypothetical protein BBO_04740 [Beauveria brongniartii RCEF 3172]|uniref:Ankyrin repeat-containing domain protein n=1 Tax=Beauveria brongniartii RCEF 3172 TaxID=1081107 RepID=A0A162HSW0_9HYPO|nr:hypothetical protein BBO_04740 [Beauveria brongniartii RCEF 3172]
MFSKIENEREQASPRRRQVANEMYDKLQKYEQSTSSQNLGGLVQELFYLMMNHYEHVGKDETTLDDIMVFLFDNENDNEQYMDSCIRWSIMVKAFSGDNIQSQPARAMALWIVREWPELAFVHLNDDKDAGGQAKGRVNGYRARCRSKHKINENPCTPFHLAAETGNHEIIGAMLDEMQPLSSSSTAPGSQSTLLDLVLAEDPRSNRGENAFALALMARETPLETLEKFLIVTKTETPTDDCSFEEAVSRGFDLAVEAYLKHGLTLDAETFGKYITMAFEKLGGKREKMDVWSKGRSVRSASSSRTCRENVVKSLVRRATTPDKFTEKVVQEIIRKDLFNVWDAKCRDVPTSEIRERLLHVAILYGRHTFVDRFVEDYPRSPNAMKKVPNTSPEEGKYPLWYNNHR